MSDLVTRAQREMLSETLGVRPEQLEHLDRLGAAGVKELRERISASLFDEHAQTFARINRLAPLIPNALVAKLSEALVPPLVAGLAAGSLGLAHPDRAGSILGHLSARYMADAAVYLDPRVVPILAPRIPMRILVAAANELMRRRAYVTVARFVDYLSDDMIRGLEQGIPDDVGLLMSAALIEAPERLREIIDAFPPRRVEAVVRSAATGEEELLAGLSVLGRLEPGLAGDLGATFVDSVDDERLGWVLRTVATAAAVPELRTLVERLPGAQRERVLAHPALAEPELAALASEIGAPTGTADAAG
jgi:hypothetical protein